MTKRNLFDELSEGLEEVKQHRDGKITLKTSTVEQLPQVEITAAEIVEVRERLNLSRAVFADILRIRTRKLEKWEQGGSTPSPEAATLIKLVDQYTDMAQRIHSL